MKAEMFVKIARRLNYPASKTREILLDNGIEADIMVAITEMATNHEILENYAKDEGKEFSLWL